MRGQKGLKRLLWLGQNVNSYGLDFKDGTDFGTLVDALRLVFQVLNVFVI